MPFIPENNTNYYIQTRLGNGLVFDVAYGSRSPGAQVIQYHCKKGANQQWKIRTEDNGRFRAQNVNSKLYLTVDKNGKLTQDTLDESKDQVFYCDDAINGGSFVRSVKRNDYVWDVPQSKVSEKTQLHAWGYNDSLAQCFYFAKSVPTTLRLNTVRCDNPAGGAFYSSLAGDVSDGIINAASVGVGGLGLAGGVAGIVVTSKAAAGVIATGGIVLAVVGLAVAVGGASLFIDKIASSEDDLYIEVDGKKVWPTDKKHHGIHKNEEVHPELKFENWTKDRQIVLWEHDWISDDDKLSGIKIDPLKNLWNTQVSVLKANDSEGSVYTIIFTLT